MKLEDVEATFSDGVLEVSVPLPAKAEATVRKVEIQDAQTTSTVKTPKTAAWNVWGMGSGLYARRAGTAFIPCGA